jgi:hypothetical protein
VPYEDQPDQFLLGEYVCFQHFDQHEDEFLWNLTMDMMGEDVCSMCRFPYAMPVENLVSVIQDSVHKFYDRASDASDPFEDREWVWPTRSTEDVVDDLGVSELCPVRLAAVEHLGDAVWVPVEYGSQGRFALLSDGWRSFCDHIVHGSRFLFDAVEPLEGVADQLGTREFLEELLRVVASEDRIFELNGESDVFRARAYIDFNSWPRDAKDYAAPPASLASQGRMNPAGISMFYGALSVETAAIEVYDGRPFAAVAVFRPTRTLRLVNLSRASIPDPLDRSFSLSDYRLAEFLEGFAAEVAKPIMRDDRIHQEYVPTQAFTEFLRFRSDPHVDGVVFPTARSRQGRNVVVFAGHDECLGGEGSLLRPTRDLHLIEYGPPAILEFRQPRLNRE